MENTAEQEFHLIRKFLEKLGEEAEFFDIKPLTINSKKDWGNSPLKIAAVRGAADLLTALLNAGADINMKNEDECTALHHAVSQGNIEAVKVLLAYEANPKQKDRYGNSAWDYSQSSEITRLLNLYL